MSLLIRGANMPKNCAVCPLERDVFGCAVCCGKADGDRIGTPIYEADLPSTDFEERRPSWCPLVEVPPHGRLIDADAYCVEMKKRQDAVAAWRDDIKSGGGYGTELYFRSDSVLSGFIEAKLTMDKIPTIIEAEGEEEDEKID